MVKLFCLLLIIIIQLILYLKNYHHLNIIEMTEIKLLK
jgi:hypothetical protein